YILNVDSSPLDVELPFYPITTKQNRVLDHCDPEEERPEWYPLSTHLLFSLPLTVFFIRSYFEWLPSLKSKTFEQLNIPKSVQNGHSGAASSKDDHKRANGDENGAAD